MRPILTRGEGSPLTSFPYLFPHDMVQPYAHTMADLQ